MQYKNLLKTQNKKSHSLEISDIFKLKKILNIMKKTNGQY